MNDTNDTKRWIAERHPLHITRLSDPVVEAHGYPADSKYAETFWLPFVGPTALWAFRRLNTYINKNTSGIVAIQLGLLSAEIGVPGRSCGPNSPIVRSLARLTRYGLTEIAAGAAVMQVRSHVPPLPARLLRRLPASPPIEAWLHAMSPQP